MPTTYAHYRFGNHVLAKLPAEYQTIIKEYRDLYNIGLHGPDLLFYYKAPKKNPVSQLGFAMHERPGYEFFQPACDFVRLLHNPSAAKAYLFGFMCHFALDSNCHPYVEQMVRQSHQTHSAIEAEFDRYLMKKDRLDPMHYRPAKHLIASHFHAMVISRFFPGVKTAEIESSIRSIRFFCSLLAPPGIALHYALRTVMKWIGCSATYRDMVIQPRRVAECVPMNTQLDHLYHHAIQDAVELIDNLEQHIQTHATLDPRLNHTFGEF